MSGARAYIAGPLFLVRPMEGGTLTVSDCLAVVAPGDFHLLQIALPPECRDGFLALAAPPPPQPGHAPMGEMGAYTAVRAGAPLLDGTPRGFEVLGYDQYGGSFHSFRCFPFEPDFTKLGASLNEWGLIDDEAVASRCAEFAGAEQTCADGWHPWLVVEHELVPERVG